MKLKALLSTICYILLPIGLLTYSLIRSSDAHFFTELGEFALNLLMLTLFFKPIVIIFRLKWLQRQLPLRRQLGIACFWLFFFHACGQIYINAFAVSDFGGFSNYLFWGLAGGIGMSLLALTSNNFSVKLLKKNWKRLHYLAYFILFAGLLHAATIEGEYIQLIVVFALFVVLKILEWTKIRFSFLRQ